MAAADDGVIIIGAGVAGLTAGAYLARAGCRVRVLDAGTKVGGCCGATSVDGYTFSDGAQYLVYHKMLDLVFAQLGAAREKVLPLRRVTTSQTTYLPDGSAITIGDGCTVSVEGAALDTAHAEEELQRTVNKWQPVGRLLESEDILLSPFSAWKLLSRAWRHLPKMRRSLDRELRSSFHDPRFCSALAAHVTYAGVPLDQLPAVAIVALVSGLTDGMAVPIGGMSRLPEALAAIVRSYGGEILLNEGVTGIRVRNGRVSGVQTTGEGFSECGRVLSTANAMSTYETLLEPGAQPASMLRKVQGTRLSAKAFSLQLGVTHRLPVQSHLSYVVPMMDDLPHYFTPERDGTGYGYYSVPTVAAAELAPAGGSVIEYFPVIRQDSPAEEWNDERAQRLADASIRWLQSRFEMQVAAQRVRSPRDFRDQLNLFDGSVYGISPAQGVTGLFPHKSSIEGLYLAGQTTYPGLGVPTAALSGIHAARLMLKADR